MAKKKKVTLTPQAYKQMNDELEELKTIGRKLLADKLDQYRDDGSTEENNAYSEVLGEKEAMEDRIIELTELLDEAKVTDKNPKCDSVGIGCEVEVKSGRSKKSFKIVSAIEPDPDKNQISDESPIGNALMKGKVGDEVSFKRPDGKKAKFEITKIKPPSD